MTDPLAEPSPHPVVSIQRADVNIDGKPILKDITWQLRPGECRGIVGANGSGKSTLLRLIAGRLWPTPGSGRRRYDFGEGVQTDAVDARTRVAEVGPELQNRYARFSWNFRTEDVVRSGLTRTDIPQRNPPDKQLRKTREIIDRLGLTDLADRRFLELSRGQQRRVLIARAIAFKPAILLLDEPASGLDALARAELGKLLTTVVAQTTIVVTAHSETDLPAVVGSYQPIADGRLSDETVKQGPTPGQVESATLSHAPAERAKNAVEPLIVVSGANVFLGERPILRDICWQLEPGEHWLITGRNGSGKSTFLRLLHGQLRPAVGGTIAWPGLGNPRNVWDLRRQIGFVSAELQAAYRYRVTAGDCVGSGFDSSFGLTRLLTPDEKNRADELLAAFELDALRDRFLTELSYGQLHRVLIARTLVNRPRVLLLDEPWEGLDPATRGLVVRQLRSAMETGTQIVCASHVGEPGLPLNRHASMLGGRLSDADADAGA